jgi:hypothetical protein
LRRIETTRERWFEAEVHRIVCDVAMMAPEGDVGEARARSQDARPHDTGAKPGEAADDNYQHQKSASERRR